MAANRAVWGIELGQCALKAICLRAADKKVEVVDHVHLEHAKILSQPDADRPALIAEAMNKLVQEHDLSGAVLVVGVPGQHTLARFTKLPPVDKKKIPEIVKYEAQQQIPFDMEEVIWDYQVFQDPETMETEVGIFAMRRDLLREHLHPLSSRDLEPGAVQSSPLALFNALKFDGLCGQEPVCILDIGAQNTDLIVVEGESLWTRNIPIGGNSFTEALVKTFKLSFRKAEKLKRDAQKHKYARQIFQAMRPAFADLVAEVQRSIGFFTSSRRGVKLGKIIAMGNAFKLPGMVKFVQQNLGMDVVRPTTFSKLSVKEAPNAPQLVDRLLSFGVAYGLALQGLGIAQITSNLLPPEIAKQVVWRKKTPWFYGVAACLALAAGIVWAKNIRDQGIIDEAAGAQRAVGLSVTTEEEAYPIIEQGPPAHLPIRLRAQAILDAGDSLQKALAEAEGRNEDLRREVENTIKLRANKLVWPAILDHIHDALPELDKDLAEALKKGPEAYRDFLTQKQEEKVEEYFRKNRKQVFIEQLSAYYSSDVMGAFEKEKEQKGRFETSSRRLETGQDLSSTAPLRGFVITLTIRTPNQDDRGNTVVRAFQEKLKGKVFLAAGEPDGSAGKKADSPPIVEFHDDIEVKFEGQTASRDGRTVTGEGPAYRAERFGDPGGTDLTVVADRNLDPVTGEPIEDDWWFTVICVAVPGGIPEATVPAAAAGVYGVTY